MLAATPLDAPWGYRHKVHFVFDSTPRGVVMGHYLRGSRRVLPVTQCPVHDPRGNELAFAFRDVFAPLGSTSLVGLAIRVGANTGETMATLVVSADTDRGVRTATRRLLERTGAPGSFHVNIHPRRDAFIFGPETRKIAGPDRMREEVAGVSFLISPTTFFQTNVAAAEILVRLVLEATDGGGGNGFTRRNEGTERLSVLDLYAGGGLFALPLAKAGRRVIAVEENRQAVEDGRASLRLNRIPEERCRFVAQPVERFLAGRVPTVDLVILDPPREGCGEAVLRRAFGGLRPARAIYISCNPEALARDLRVAVEERYEVASLQPVDMFPHTDHVETVAVLDRMGPRN